MTMAIRTVADADVRACPDSSDMDAHADIGIHRCRCDREGKSARRCENDRQSVFPCACHVRFRFFNLRNGPRMAGATATRQTA